MKWIIRKLCIALQGSGERRNLNISDELDQDVKNHTTAAGYDTIEDMGKSLESLRRLFLYDKVTVY